MKAILIACTDSGESRIMMDTIGQSYSVNVTNSAKGLAEHISKSALLAIDSSFTDSFGMDYLFGIVRQAQRPVLVLVPPDGITDAMEAVRVGAANYVVKTNGYKNVLNLSIEVAMDRFKEQQQAKDVISSLQKRIEELETSSGSDAAPGAAPATEANILDEIVFIFKRGEINLPSPPQISIKFKQLVSEGANIQHIGALLKNDAAIASKLISISNSAFYRGVAENKTLEQAVGRLGLTTTKRYVDVITNRTLYFTKNKKFTELIESLWDHSLSSAYAAQSISELLKLTLPEDAFTLGLLHDIGKLVLLQAVGDLQMKKKIGEEIDPEELSRTVDTNHGKFGGALLKRWKFSNVFVEVAMYHDYLEEADPITKELLVVHFANHVVKTMGYGMPVEGEDTVALEEVESARLLKLNPEMIDQIKDRVKTHMEELKGFFT